MIAIVACLIASAALGALTHLAWDGITQTDGWAVERFLALRARVELPVIGSMAMHRVVQHTCSVLGSCIMGLLIVRALRHQSAEELPAVPRAGARVAFAVCIAAGIALLLARLATFWNPSPGDLVVAPISGTLAGILIASLMVRRASRRLDERSPAGA